VAPSKTVWHPENDQHEKWFNQQRMMDESLKAFGIIIKNDI